MSMNVVKIKNNRSKGNHDRQFLLYFTLSGFRDKENWCNVIFLNQIMLSHIVMRLVREFETKAQPGIKELNFSRETLTGFQLNAQCCCLREKIVMFIVHHVTIYNQKIKNVFYNQCQTIEIIEKLNLNTFTHKKLSVAGRHNIYLAFLNF